jgi:hypothetical protein
MCARVLLLIFLAMASALRQIPKVEQIWIATRDSNSDISVATSSVANNLSFSRFITTISS